MKNNKPHNYPKIGIRSKIELAKRLSDCRNPVDKIKGLIDDVVNNYDQYWIDHARLSEPEKGKWVRDASRSNLGKLLKLISERVLTPHDHMVPVFVFGGLKKRNHKTAVEYLLGTRRQRIILKLDVTRFYEQIKSDRVHQFFLQKTNCGNRGAKLLTKLCCVPVGAKDKPENYKSIGRGFSTSSRLAVWCNLDTFIKLDRLIRKELKGKDPRIAVYVDDIAITASRATKEDLIKLYPKIIAILNSDSKQPLPLNNKKTKIITHTGDTYDIGGNHLGCKGFEHLGIQMKRNSLEVGVKTKSKITRLKNKHKDFKNNTSLTKSLQSLRQYENYITKNETAGLKSDR